MEITYKNLINIDFPIYLLPSDNWDYKDGLLYLDGQVLDDRNQPQKTLGGRRLATPHKPLMPLKHAIMDEVVLLKQTGGRSYIDNQGRIFTYTKSRWGQLKSQLIKRVDLKETYSLLRVWNVNFPIRVPRPPDPDMNWATLLYINDSPWRLWGYTNKRQKPKRRKI
jgi:hypothetical protein